MKYLIDVPENTIEIFRKFAKKVSNTDESTEELLCRMLFIIKELIIIQETYNL